jgi:hypothetical protein
MKKILTLLIAFGAIASVQAQSSRYPSDRNESRDIILGDQNSRTYEGNSRYGNGYSFSARERDEQIDRINREFNQRIRRVERDRWMRTYEKRREVQRLEEQRKSEIRQVWERFRNSRNTYRDYDYRRNDRRW